MSAINHPTPAAMIAPGPTLRRASSNQPAKAVVPRESTNVPRNNFFIGK